jgi:hypothetical protein
MDKNVYKVEFYFEGSEDDAQALRRSLAQSVADDFEISRVFGVLITTTEDSEM